MTNRKSRRQALFMSVMALVLCCAMLVGTTMAWFTDSVSSVNNKIVAGNLDIELFYQNDETDDWTEVKNDSNIFKEDTLWEPGHVEVVTLKVNNAGTLALKYQLGINIAAEISSVNMAGDPFKVSDYIKFAVIDGEQNYDRAQAVAAAEAASPKAINAGYTNASSLLTEESDIVTVVVYMPETVNNEANHAKDAAQPTVTLGLDLQATQVTNEYDSFGNDYDATAEVLSTVVYHFSNEADLLAFAPTAGDAASSGLSINNGTAQIDKSGAWITKAADLSKYSYSMSYDLDITGLAEGESVTVDTGESKGWGSTPIYIERGSAKVYYGTHKNEEIGTLEGTKLHVTHYYSMNSENKLEIGTTVTDGIGTLRYSKSVASEPANTLYWDIYGVTESGKAFMDNFTITTYEAIIDSAAELQVALEAALEDDNAVIELSGNVVLTESWTPIGDKEAGIFFTGTFDGNGHTISGLKVEDGDYVALFGAVKDATIKNVTVSGTVQGENPAGIAARCEGTTVIENCVNNANIISSTKAGGIVCNVTKAENVKIINCVNNGSISGTATSGLGGIVGYVNNDGNVVIENCTNNGDVTGSSAGYAGAAIGYAAGTSKGNIVNFTNTGSITGKFSTDHRILKQGDTVLAGYCGTPDNWKLSTSVGGADYVYSGSDMVLYLVPAGYEGTSFTPAEGTTNIGSYAFAYNSNIETITLPSTVRTLSDRAFRDTSASNVVLNEGLENISYQAFRNALNVTGVEIPSTVKTISKEAFQNSGIKTLTVPASVTTIEYGAMRDMKELETVVIESGADIPVYAFRACTNLKTVYLNNENVTFGGGSRGMIFTNKENGDGSAITIYVKSEAVKERLLAADTAAKDYGGYKIIVSP